MAESIGSGVGQEIKAINAEEKSQPLTGELKVGKYKRRSTQ